MKALAGPLESPEEVDHFVKNFKGTQVELAKAIDTQLKFYKKVIDDRSVNPDLYKSREKDMSNGGKYRTHLSESVEPVKIPDSIEYVAAFYDGEEQPWYPGIVTKYVDSKSCECCKVLADIEGLSSTCYMAKFMTPVESDLYEMSENLEYHVHPSQLLCTPIVEYVQFDNGGLGYKILNYQDVMESIKNNQLFLCL